MITEDYVSFETAKHLKENGFDAECDYLYVDGKLVRAQGGACNWNRGETLFTDYKNECSAPSLQMVMKWLRETYNINPVPYALSLGWAFDIFDLSDRDITGCKKLYSMDFPSKSEVYRTYEEACEGAIKYCLENLI